MVYIQQTTMSMSTLHQPHPALNLWSLLFFLVFWQAIYRVANAAILSLLSFLKYFTVFLGNAFQCQSLTNTAKEIPCSYQKLRKVLGMSDNFIEYVLCPNCYSL